MSQCYDDQVVLYDVVVSLMLVANFDDDMHAILHVCQALVLDVVFGCFLDEIILFYFPLV